MEMSASAPLSPVVGKKDAKAGGDHSTATSHLRLITDVHRIVGSSR